jgi:hypothetical protein
MQRFRCWSRQQAIEPFSHDRARQHCTKTTSAAPICYVSTKANAGSDGERACSLHPTHSNRGGPPNPTGECPSRHPLTLRGAHLRGCDAKLRTAIANGRSRRTGSWPVPCGSLPACGSAHFKIRPPPWVAWRKCLHVARQVASTPRAAVVARTRPCCQFRKTFLVFASSPPDNAAVGHPIGAAPAPACAGAGRLIRRGEPRLIIRAA